MAGLSIARRPSEVRVTEVAAKHALNRVRGMGFRWSLNPYQGCAHQCVFCYARSTHAYRELDGVREWGSRIVAKVNLARALRADLARPSWRNESIAIGTATDPYQSHEGRYRLMRGVLAALRDARCPFHIITRSPLIVRDLDLLVACARRADVGVAVSIATLDAALARRIEPTVAPPQQRLRAVAALAAAGIRVGVAVAPILPDLTDEPASLARVVRAAADAGAHDVWHSTLHLGEVTRDAYFAFLDQARPDLVERYRRIYRSGKYAEGAYVGLISNRMRAARAGVRFAPYRHRPIPAANSSTCCRHQDRDRPSPRPMTWLKWAGPRRLAVSLTALLIAAPTHVLAEAPVLDSQTIAAKIIETNGAPPARFRETLETVNEHGEHTIRTVYRDGSDARSVSDSGPFHEENGTLHGQAWRQNANGQTILRQPDPGDERRVLPTTTVTRITEPVVGYVVARLDEHGEGTKDYVDASTWRIVRQDGVTANGTSVTTYDDFRSDGGRVFTHHWRTVNGINHTTTDTTVTAYVPGGVTAADLAIPPPARALVEFPPGVTSVTLPTHFSDRPFNGERINVRLTIAGRGLDFVLDTGASGILMDSTVARQLGLHLYQQQSAVTAARYESAEAVVPEIHVGDLVMHNVAVHVAPLGFDKGTVKEVGLLGFDFLAELGVTIDYDQERVTVVPGDAFVPPTAPNAIAVPVRVGDGEQEVTLTFNGAVGERWGLDTGVPGTFMVFGHFATRYPDAVRQDRVVRGYARYGVGSGVGGSFDAERLHVRSVVLGNVTFTDVIGTLVTQSGAYDSPMDGVIGASFLHFFTVELDDTHSTVYFIPNEAGKRAGLK